MKITVLGAAGRMGQMRARHLIEMGYEVLPIDPADPSMLQSHHEFRYEKAGIDAVVIASPSDRHANQLATAVASGCHVFVEKPLCLIGQMGLRKILTDAAGKSLVVATGYNLRFHPAVMHIKDQITSGALRPLWCSFLLRQKPQRPLAHFLEEWASHEVDLAMHLLGPAHRVKNIHQSRFRDADQFMQMAIDHADVDVRWNFGLPPTSFIHADAVTDPPRRAFTLVDQDGHSITCDIETDHVQEDHYKAELRAWCNMIHLRGEAGVINDHLATGEDGLAVIELLERLTK